MVNTAWSWLAMVNSGHIFACSLAPPLKGDYPNRSLPNQQSVADEHLFIVSQWLHCCIEVAKNSCDPPDHNPGPSHQWTLMQTSPKECSLATIDHQSQHWPSLLINDHYSDYLTIISLSWYPINHQSLLTTKRPVATTKMISLGSVIPQLWPWTPAWRTCGAFPVATRPMDDQCHMTNDRWSTVTIKHIQKINENKLLVVIIHWCW